MRYVYATYRSRERAENALEDMFASSEVSEGERPLIEPKPYRHEGRVRTEWQVTLEG